MSIVTYFSCADYNTRSISQCFHGDSPADCSNPDEIALSSEEEDNEQGSTPVPPSFSSTTPHKPRYPWLDHLSGDEQESPGSGQTGLSTTGVGDCETSFSDVQKSLQSEFSSESHDRSCDLGSGSHDISEGESAGLEVVPVPDSNPDEILLDDDM